MASGVRGVLVGALTLVAIQTVVQPDASGRVAGLAGLAGSAAEHFLNPALPAIPDTGRGGGSGFLVTPDPPASTPAPAPYPSPSTLPHPITPTGPTVTV